MPQAVVHDAKAASTQHHGVAAVAALERRESVHALDVIFLDTPQWFRPLGFKKMSRLLSKIAQETFLADKKRRGWEDQISAGSSVQKLVVVWTWIYYYTWYVLAGLTADAQTLLKTHIYSPSPQ
jgi:hypothetical protein